MTTQVTHVSHFFRSAFGGRSRQHACLHFGYWCWSNALTNPLMAFRYLANRKKVKVTLGRMGRRLYDQLMKEK